MKTPHFPRRRIIRRIQRRRPYDRQAAIRALKTRFWNRLIAGILDLDRNSRNLDAEIEAAYTLSTKP